MERYRRRYQQFIKRFRDDKGQSTVEYAVVLGAVLCVVVALGMLSQVVKDGLFVQHALAAASHHVQASVGWIADIFSY